MKPLPTRDGVSPSVVGLPEGPWPTLAAFLAERFPRVQAQVWAQRLARGEVVDEQGLALPPDAAYRAHQRLWYYREIPDEATPLAAEAVLYQDEHVVVADKPPFMPVTPGGRYLHGSLLVRLRQRLGLEHLAPLHRIDRETRGLVLFGVQPQQRDAYAALFRSHAVHKTYEAITPWPPQAPGQLYSSRLAPDDHFMRMREAPGAPNSHTRIELLERSGDLARWRLQPLTGRRHQLRVHCAALGMPILHDRLYPVLQPPGNDDPQQALQLLAAQLAYTDPFTGAAMHFVSQLRLDWPPA